MKTASLLANIRQLCCLGLGGETLLPEILKAMHGWVPSSNNLFLWKGEDDAPSNIYVEHMVNLDATRSYLRDFVNTRKEQAYGRPSFALMMKKKQEKALDNSAWYDPKIVTNTAMYNDVWKPFGVAHSLRFTVRDHTRTHGLLMMTRPHTDKPFTAREETRMAQVVLYLAHALHTPKLDNSGDYVHGGDSGMLILGPGGKLLHACPRARELLLLATGATTVHELLADRPPDAMLPPPLLKLCQDLRTIFRGAAAAPPVLHHINPWGLFVFRAYFLSALENPDGLNGPDNAEQGLIGLTVEQHIPLKLRRWRRISALPLSAKQREICLLLGEGLSYMEIAARLGISPNTARDYIRLIYDKLDVPDREGLLKYLLD
jgi:DNA-binding CsgD family transcriptional regulator